MAQKTFSKSEIKEFLEQWPKAQICISKKSRIMQKDNILFVDAVPLFFQMDSEWIPTLKLLLQHPTFLPKVVVDKGAIRFVVNGADVMRPGITNVEEFNQDAIVVIVDETLGKPIAVGRTMFDSNALLALEGGKCIKSLHYISDEIWNA